MNSSSLMPPRAALTSVRCDVAAYAAVAMAPEHLPVLRRNPGPALREPISPALLKHADHQTVAGLAAVLQAIHEHGLKDVAFRDWGAIAGPSFLGRQASAEAIQRFREEGAFAISPHLIPHESLHAVSGTVSQVLGLHGSNFGVGGGPGAADEAVLVAATMLADGNLPGLWLILTAFDPEMVPAKGGETPAPWLCHAVALALVPQGNGHALGIQVAISGPDGRGDEELPALCPATLGAALPRISGSARGWRLRSGGRLQLAPSPAAAENFGA